MEISLLLRALALEVALLQQQLETLARAVSDGGPWPLPAIDIFEVSAPAQSSTAKVEKTPEIAEESSKPVEQSSAPAPVVTQPAAIVVKPVDSPALDQEAPQTTTPKPVEELATTKVEPPPAPEKSKPVSLCSLGSRTSADKCDRNQRSMQKST